MTVRSRDELIGVPNGIILQRLPDNNAGQISAADVRDSIVDTVDSIINIVRNNDFSVQPFLKDVSIKNGVSGILEVGSGIKFSDGKMQYTAYQGAGGIQHDTLGGLTAGDPHTQYLRVDGGRQMLNNLGLGIYWINSSGNTTLTTSTGRGLSFSYVNNSSENVNVGSGTSLYFQKDKSVMNSARGVAKAWINFDASGINGLPTVRDSYNVSGIQKLETGKFKIIFHSGVFANNNYVAIGSSNSTTASGSKEDFANNTIGMVMREGNDGTSLRSLTFVIRDDGGQYVNAKINDLVVYGTEPGGSGQPPVTILT